jgi:hypothetical protein
MTPRNDRRAVAGLRTRPHRVARQVLVKAGIMLMAGSGSILRAQTDCARLVDLSLDHTRIISAVWVPAGDIPSTPNQTSRSAANVAAHCEVKAVATPTSDSDINFELWLPAASDWNGKYLQIGSGGWGGVIGTRGLITPLNRGYATAATDEGHKADGTGHFAIGHPERLIDFGYRAVHETSQQSRLILKAFYGKPHRRAYFVGCSDGGRAAMMQAERFPEDFDGIVAGAPADHWTHQFAGFVWNERALFMHGESALPASKLALLQNAAIQACDGLDGVRDGIISEPLKCHFDPAVLLCKTQHSDACLTKDQIAAVKKIYSGPKDPVTGEQIYPGFEPGMEAEDFSWKHWMLEHRQADFGNSSFGDAVYEGQKWDWRTSNLHDDLLLADEKVTPVVNSFNPDLRSFRDHGGKLIVYQGWEDAAVAPRDAIDYYNQVQQFMTHYPDPRVDGGSASTDLFYRLFMVPGMGHCWDGVGPSTFGNRELPTAGIPQDPDHDVVLALDKWVDQGVAPDRMIATKTNDADPTAGPSKGAMTRPLCPYPKVGRYTGTGSTSDAGNFQCVSDGGSLENSRK